MNVSLTPQLQEYVDSKVASGLYNNASEVIREGLRLLKEHDEIRLKWREQIERGWLQVQAADFESQRAGVANTGERSRTRSAKRT